MADTQAQPPPPAAPSDTTAGTQQPLSKNAQKKLAKAARFAEQKKERRAYEKEKKKEKKRMLAAKRDAGELGADDEGPRKKARTDGPRVPFEARVVVDLGFDDMMSENEIKSLTSQLAFTYAANRKAVHPFSTILFTSVNGRTFTRLEEIGDAAYKRWHDTEWWQEGYERLWEGHNAAEAQSTPQDVKPEPAEDGATAANLLLKPQSAPQETVVYLTADSSDELSELKAGETYIIGGICDHNRYKNLCFGKAESHKIRSARLPIGTYLAEMKTRKVLTVNQTFEILLKWVETRDWKEAFETVIPKRKFNEKGKDSNPTDLEPKREEDAPRQLVIDTAALEDEEAIKEEEQDDDVETAGEESGTLVVATEDTDVSIKNDLTTVLDDGTHAEIPS